MINLNKQDRSCCTSFKRGLLSFRNTQFIALVEKCGESESIYSLTKKEKECRRYMMWFNSTCWQEMGLKWNMFGTSTRGWKRGITSRMKVLSGSCQSKWHLLKTVSERQQKLNCTTAWHVECTDVGTNGYMEHPQTLWSFGAPLTDPPSEDPRIVWQAFQKPITPAPATGRFTMRWVILHSVSGSLTHT